MKTAPGTPSKEDLTVLVFKDNSTARTFHVPMGWISRLGLIGGAVAAVAVLGLFLSVKYYIAARQALRTTDPSYVQDLEQEVAALRAAKSTAPNAPQVSTPPASVANPAPTVTVTATPAATTASTGNGSNLSFSAFPASTQGPPAGAEISIGIYEPHVNWVGRTLRVQFFIQYTKEDKGNQQGRIVLLARGGDTLLAYPAGVLNPSDSASLVAPEKGEYFSVSRIREVKADFGPMKSNTALKSVEVFLFSNEGRLLVHQTLTPGMNGPGKQKDEEDT